MNFFFYNFAITVVVSLVADFGLFHCQAATNLKRAKNVEFATAPAIKFTTCYQLAFHWHRTHLFYFQYVLSIFFVNLFVGLSSFIFFGDYFCFSPGWQSKLFCKLSFERKACCGLQMCLLYVRI